MKLADLEKQQLFCNIVIRDTMSVCGECGQNPIHCGEFYPCSRIERMKSNEWDGILHRVNRELEEVTV